MPKRFLSIPLPFDPFISHPILQVHIVYNRRNAFFWDFWEVFLESWEFLNRFKFFRLVSFPYGIVMWA